MTRVAFNFLPCLCIVLFPSALHAATAAFSYTAIIEHSNNLTWTNLGLTVGDEVSGSFLYQLGHPDDNPSSTTGEYWMRNYEGIITLQAGPVLFQSDSDVRSFVSNDSNYSLDVFAMNAFYSVGGGLDIVLKQVIGPGGVPANYFANDDLPLELDIAALPDATFIFSSAGYYMDGRITSVVSMPEPSRCVLLLTGLLALHTKRRR